MYVYILHACRHVKSYMNSITNEMVATIATKPQTIYVSGYKEGRMECGACTVITACKI